jgi:hypothetical protein
MSRRACLVIAVAWLVSLAAVTTAGRFESTRPRQADGALDRRAASPVVDAGSPATSAADQARRFVPFAAPRVMSGEDLGFRVEGMYGEQPAGTVVIRVNGKWVEAMLAPVVMGAPLGK